MAPPSPAPEPPAPPRGLRRLDFRAAEDDAWYSVCLQMERGEVLRVMYVNFSEELDQRVPLDQFCTESEVEAFAARFRLPSAQLQDKQCQEASAGAAVCVAHAFGESDVRFYDAIVENVSPSEHILVEEDEICKCKFEILWQHGPLAGDRATIGVENICFIQPRCLKMDPVLDHFLDLASKKIGIRSSQTDLATSSQTPRKCKKARRSNAPSINEFQLKKPSDPLCTHEEVMTDNLDDIMECRSTGRAFKRRKPVDMDFGGIVKKNDEPGEKYYFICVENVENDLSPFTLMEFIQKMTSISTQPIIFPGNSEFSSRLIIFVDTKKKVEQLYDFLHNSENIIISLSGRPWIINEKWNGSVNGALPRFKEQSQRNHDEYSAKLKLALKGTVEFEKGKKLIELHMEYHEHVERLHKKLASMERELLEKL